MNAGDIELSHLRHFLVLAEELHFGRAAARLHMTQPPLTRQIQALESRLSCRLLERNSRSTQLNPAGELLRDRARAIITDADELFARLQSAGRGEEGPLTVATAPSLMLGELPGVIRRFRAAYPRVSFRLAETASSAILQAVGTGAADAGFVRGRDKSANIAAYATWKEPMTAILPPGHMLAGEKTLRMKQLQGEAFVFFPRHLGPSFFDEIATQCQRAGFILTVAQEARQWSSIISLVSAGIGVSVCPASMTELMPRGVTYVPLPGVRTTARLIIRRGGEANPILAHFLRIAAPAYTGKKR